MSDRTDKERPTAPRPDAHAEDRAAYARGVDIAGTHIAREEIAAEYIVMSECWTDMPEANPRARAMVAGGQPASRVVITRDGRIHAGPEVEIDRYEGQKYASVRAEGEARHRHDRTVGRA